MLTILLTIILIILFELVIEGRYSFNEYLLLEIVNKIDSIIE